MIRLPFVPWRHLLAGLILVILLVPIRRYSLPADLPFQLELYRLFVAVLVVGWIGSLLVDRRVRLRRTGFEGPLAVILGSRDHVDRREPGARGRGLRRGEQGS